MWTSALFSTKSIGFFMVCPHGQEGRGLSQCGKGGGRSIFRDFERTSFMDGP